MNYLILGGNGLCGKSFRKLLEGKCNYFATSRNPGSFKNAIKCDILNQGDLKAAFEISKPEIVINAANLAGGVDFCEKNPQQAENFHLQANQNIAALCKEYGARMVMISTDYVFDGKNPPYSEENKTNPLNHYGKFKLQAEKWMQSNLDNYLIIRTTNVFGWDPDTKTPNFIMGVYFNLQKGVQEIRVPSFLYGNPTLAEDLAKGIMELCEKNMTGVFHIVGKSCISRYEWVLKFFDRLNIDKKMIIEINKPNPDMVPRPLISNLSTKKFEKFCSTVLKDADEGLNEFIKQMHE